MLKINGINMPVYDQNSTLSRLHPRSLSIIQKPLHLRQACHVSWIQRHTPDILRHFMRVLRYVITNDKLYWCSNINIAPHNDGWILLIHIIPYYLMRTRSLLNSSKNFCLPRTTPIANTSGRTSLALNRDTTQIIHRSGIYLFITYKTSKI